MVRIQLLHQVAAAVAALGSSLRSSKPDCLSWGTTLVFFPATALATSGESSRKLSSHFASSLLVLTGLLFLLPPAPVSSFLGFPACFRGCVPLLLGFALVLLGLSLLCCLMLGLCF